MVKIIDIIPQLKPFYNHFRDLYTLSVFRLFTIYTMSLVVLPKHQKTVRQISKSWQEPINRSSLQRLLSEVHWEFDKVLQRARTQLFRRLSHLRKHERKLTLVLDDTTLKKFGNDVFGVGWYRKNIKDKSTLGVQVVVVGVLVGGWLVPLDFRIYVQECVCKFIPMKFESKLEQASQMLHKLKLPKDFLVELMFDSWYLNHQITTVAEKRHFNWFGRVAVNRTVLWDGKKSRQKLSKYVDKNSACWKKLEYPTTRKYPAVVGHQQMGHLKKIGRVKLVFSSLDAKGEKKVACFATNHPHTPLVNVIQKYEKRWKIEVFFKEARRHLGLEHWYFRDIASVVHHLCLVIVSAIACAWLRCENKKTLEKEVSWGEFIGQLQVLNQRRTLKWYLEKWEEDISMSFEQLCSLIGL